MRSFFAKKFMQKMEVRNFFKMMISRRPSIMALTDTDKKAKHFKSRRHGGKGGYVCSYYIMKTQNFR